MAKKDRWVLNMFSHTGAIVQTDRKEAIKHLTSHAFVGIIKNRGNVKLLHTRE